MVDSDFIQKCADGDKEALELLYRLYAPKMLRIIRRYISDSTASQDILHDGFVVIFTRIGDIRDVSKIELWMGTIMKNLCIGYLSSLDLTTILDEEFEDPDTPLFDDILSFEELESIINRLPDGYRKIFKLAVLENKSHREIGKILGIAPHTSSSQLYHARLLLQRMIKERRAELGLLIAALMCGTGLVYLIGNRPDLHPHISNPDNSSLVAQATEAAATPVITEDINAAGRASSAPAATLASSLSASPDNYGSKTDTTDRNTTTQKDSESAAQDSKVGDSDIFSENIDGNGQSENRMDSTPDTTGETEAGNSASDQRSAEKLTVEASIAEDNLPELPNDYNKGKWNFSISFSIGGKIAGSGSFVDANCPPIGNLTPPDQPTPGGPDIKPPVGSDDPDPDDGNNDESEINRCRGGNSVPVLNFQDVTHEMPVVFGVNLNRRIAGPLSAEIGVNYTLLRSTLTFGNPNYTVRRKVSSHYIGIPVKLNIDLFRFGGFSLYATGGGSLDIPLVMNTSETFIKGKPCPISLPELSNRIQWSAFGGIGVQYRFSQNAALYAEPSVVHYFNNNSSMPTFRQDNPTLFSLPIGVRIIW